MCLWRYSSHITILNIFISIFFPFLDYLNVVQYSFFFSISLFLPVLLRYNWHTTLHKFKVYRMIWLTSWNGYHSRFSEHLSFHIDAKWRKRKIVFFLIRTVEIYCLQFSSVQSLSRFRLFATPWIEARQASLSITNSWSSLKLTSIESVMPCHHLILCRPFFLLPPIPPSIRVFSNESTLHMRWPRD